jgi:hypothetical protein
MSSLSVMTPAAMTLADATTGRWYRGCPAYEAFARYSSIASTGTWAMPSTIT